MIWAFSAKTILLYADERTNIETYSDIHATLPDVASCGEEN
jgi:hypothetical protein